MFCAVSWKIYMLDDRKRNWDVAWSDELSRCTPCPEKRCHFIFACDSAKC